MAKLIDHTGRPSLDIAFIACGGRAVMNSNEFPITPGQPEIDHLQPAVFADDNIGCLEIARDHPVLVRLSEGVELRSIREN
jgi:hypothetical protein